MKPFFPAGLDHDRTEIVAIEKHPNMHAFRRIKLADQFSSQLRGLAEGAFQGPAVFFLEVEPKTKGDGIASELQDCHDILMASDLSAGYGVVEPADPLHGLAAFLLFGTVQGHFDTLTGLGVQQRKQVAGFQLQDCYRVPAVYVEEVVKSAAVVLARSIQPPIEVGDGASSPCEGDQQDQSSKVLEVVPVELIVQGIEERLDFFGETDDLKHIGNLLSIRFFINSYIEEIAVFC